jgi:hypothetical protein
MTIRRERLGDAAAGAGHPCRRFEASCLDQGAHCRPLDPR